MEFFKVHTIYGSQILVRKGMMIEPRQTIKTGSIVEVPAVMIQGGVCVDGIYQNFDKVNFCCEHRIDTLYDSINEEYLQHFVSRFIEQSKLTINRIRFGVSDN